MENFPLYPLVLVLALVDAVPLLLPFAPCGQCPFHGRLVEVRAIRWRDLLKPARLTGGSKMMGYRRLRLGDLSNAAP